MSKNLTANYVNILGKPQVNQKQQIAISSRIAIVKNGKIFSQRCLGCTDYEIKNRKVQPRMMEKISHKKGCKYN